MDKNFITEMSLLRVPKCHNLSVETNFTLNIHRENYGICWKDVSFMNLRSQGSKAPTPLYILKSEF